MIDTQGMISVAEAAKRLSRSREQVRRKLREGKLRGQRIGGQWFVEEASLTKPTPSSKTFVPLELRERIRRNREAIYQRNGIIFDAVALVNEVRDSDF